MKRVFLVILYLYSLGTLIAQSVINVSGEYTYVAPVNVSIEDAKRIALERARLQCLADRFGTMVNQSNSTIIHSVDGNSEVSHFSLGGTEVKGEWLGDTKPPVYKISYDEANESNVVYVKVYGKARAIAGDKIDLSIKILCNGITPRHERETLYEGDQLFLSFISPVSGYVCVYLVDEELNVYCLLPYEDSRYGAQPVEANQNHLFFSKELSPEPQIVDEYVMSCTHNGESNVFFIIFSPNELTKAIDHSSYSSLYQLTYEGLQEWLLDIQIRDPKVQVVRRTIIINKITE